MMRRYWPRTKIGLALDATEVLSWPIRSTAPFLPPPSAQLLLSRFGPDAEFEDA